MKIEKGKFYKLRDGSKYECYATDRGGDFPIHGAVNRGCIWGFMGHRADGYYYLNREPSPYDIVAEWVEPAPWENCKVDDLVVVCDNGIGENHLRYFAGIKDGKPATWDDGRTSLTAYADEHATTWDNCRPATPEEIEAARKVPK